MTFEDSLGRKTNYAAEMLSIVTIHDALFLDMPQLRRRFIEAALTLQKLLLRPRMLRTSSSI